MTTRASRFFIGLLPPGGGKLAACPVEQVAGRQEDEPERHEQPGARDDLCEHGEALEGREDHQADGRQRGQPRAVAQDAEDGDTDGDDDVHGDTDGRVCPVDDCEDVGIVTGLPENHQDGGGEDHERSDGLEPGGAADEADRGPGGEAGHGHPRHEPEAPHEVGRGDVRECRCEERGQRQPGPYLSPHRREPRQSALVQGTDRDGGHRDDGEGQDDGERRGRVPQDLPDEPGDQGRDADQQRTEAAHGIGVDEGAGAPQPHQQWLEGRYLQRLRRLEHHGPEREGGEQPDRADHRGGHQLLGVEYLAADEQRQPDHDDGEEAGERGQLVEVGGDQPDQADPHEDGTQREQQPGQGEAPGGVVATEDRGGLGLLNEALVLPDAELPAEPLQLGRGGRSGGGSRADVGVHVHIVGADRPPRMGMGTQFGSVSRRAWRWRRSASLSQRERARSNASRDSS